MNRSEISNEFNFDNELDITQNKKVKDQSFSKSGFAFEDFMNIGDKTMKSDKMSSKIYNNTSQILRKDQESVINTNIVDYLTQHSIKAKKNASVLENLSLSNSPQNVMYAISPKFADQMKTSKSIRQDTKKEIQLQKVESGGRTNIQEYINNKNPSKSGTQNAFKKKDYASKLKEDQYKQLQDQLHYYEDSLQKIIYQSQRMQDQTQNLMANFNTNTHDIYLQSYSKDIQQINGQIQEERNLQAQLAKMIDQLEQEYQHLVNSIKTSNFARPVKMKDEAKALVDQINTLKAEFQALERDDGSLNLSSTLLQNQSSHQVGNTFRIPPKKDCKIGSLRIQQIYEQNKKSQDPRFLYNIKMACLRDEWNIYTNSQIQINVSYRNSPKIKLTLGNKINKDLQKFSFKEGSINRLDGQTISAKSYIVHQIEMKQDIVDQLFIKIQLSYVLEKQKKSICLFIPTGITNFGDFSPITQKQFSLDAGKDIFENNSGFRPLDKKLINNITEIEYYMPNLLIDRDNYKCFGLFISPFNDFTFLIIRQKGQLTSIAAKTPNWPLIRVLEFIFTL